MTRAELHRPVRQWSDDEIRRWRRAKRGGVKPATVYQRQRQAKRRSVYVCWEVKSQAFGVLEVAERIVEDVRRAGGVGFFMALVTMPGWREKARAIHTAGGQFALLAHGAPRPRDLDVWKPFITRIWGGWA